MSRTSKTRSGAITRRSFLKTTGAVVGTAAVAGKVAPRTVAALAAEHEGTEEERIVINGCQYAGCASCQTEVIVREGKVVGNRRWAAEPRGNRPCLKGLAKFQRLYAQERVRYPMQRVGERGENEWERISWDEALDTIKDKWSSYMAEYGPQSICVLGSGSKGGGYIHSSIMTRLQNVMGWSHGEPCDDMAMAKGINKVFGPSYNTWGYPYLEFATGIKDSKTVISWSSNRTVAGPQDWRSIAENQARGMKLVTVDPTYTVLAQKSDLWVRPRCGSDTVLIFALIRCIVSEGLQDTSFLLHHTSAPILVWEDTRRYVRMSDFGVEPTIGALNPLTGQPIVVDPPVVWDADDEAPRSLYDSARPALSGTRTIKGRKATSSYDLLMNVVDEWTLEKASALTDVPPDTIEELAQICADGPVYHLTGYGSQSYNNGVQNGHALATLGAVTGNTCKPGASIGAGWYGPTYNLQYTSPTSGQSVGIPYLALFDVMSTQTFKGNPWPIKSLLLDGVSLVGGFPDTNRVISDILDNAEFVVAVDIVFCDQTRYADLVLPCAHPYEMEEYIITGSWVIHDEKAIDPLYECKTDGEICRLLGCLFGHEDLFDMTDEECARMAFDSDSMRALGISIDKINELHAMRWLAEDYCPEPTFQTETTRMEFYVDSPTPRLDYGQQFDFDAEHLPRWFPPTEAWPENEIMTRYPLVFMSERARNRYHTQDAESSWLLETEPEPIIRINPDDASERGLVEGDYVEVRNDRGYCVAKARISAAIRPGTVVYPKGWQMQQFKAGYWGSLHNSQFDPVGVNDSYFDSVCEVSKWNEGA